jgi:hypothetical protein
MMIKRFRQRTQSNVFEKSGDSICNYCGRHLPAAALKRSGAFFSCIDSDNCLDYQNENNNTKQEDDGSNTHTAEPEASTSEPMDNSSETLLNSAEGERSPVALEAEDFSSNLFELPETPKLENNEIQPQDSTEKINDAILNLQNVFNHELQEMEERLKKGTGNVHQKVQERKRIARELRLDKKLVEIYEEIKHYPSWSKRDDWLTCRDFEIEDPQVSEVEHEKTISFDFKENHYSLKYFDDGSSTDFDGEYFHYTKLTLQDNFENKLIEINISVEYDYMTVLSPFDITAFVPGEWMKDFLEGSEQMKCIKKKKELERKYDSDYVSSLKKNFGLE